MNYVKGIYIQAQILHELDPKGQISPAQKLHELGPTVIYHQLKYLHELGPKGHISPAQILYELGPGEHTHHLQHYMKWIRTGIYYQLKYYTNWVSQAYITSSNIT